MGVSDWLLFTAWVGLIGLCYRVAVHPSGTLSNEMRDAIRRSVPVRHERVRDGRSGVGGRKT